MYVRVHGRGPGGPHPHWEAEGCPAVGCWLWVEGIGHYDVLGVTKATVVFVVITEYVTPHGLLQVTKNILYKKVGGIQTFTYTL